MRGRGRGQQSAISNQQSAISNQAIGRSRHSTDTKKMKQLCGLVILLALAVSGCGGDGGDSPTAPSPAPTINVAFSTTDLRVGTGAEATTSRQAAVNYTGWIYSTTATDNKGAQFDTSIGRSPLVLTPPWNVIQGFSMGVVGMRVGGVRRVVIPPNLGYGNNSPGSPIRANETLLFEIELLAVQ
jgi:FKBP-type peptidyl-prolyl cis-trans isomerase FkpA